MWLLEIGRLQSLGQILRLYLGKRESLVEYYMTPVAGTRQCDLSHFYG